MSVIQVKAMLHTRLQLIRVSGFSMTVSFRLKNQPVHPDGSAETQEHTLDPERVIREGRISPPTLKAKNVMKRKTDERQLRHEARRCFSKCRAERKRCPVRIYFKIRKNRSAARKGDGRNRAFQRCGETPSRRRPGPFYVDGDFENQ